jgi:hypothetical protein
MEWAAAAQAVQSGEEDELQVVGRPTRGQLAAFAEALKASAALQSLHLQRKCRSPLAAAVAHSLGRE